jgi:hypothetical protein
MTDIAPTAPAHLAWPDHFAVAHMPGSLPMGGVVPMTPIFAFREPAPRLALPRDHGLTPHRTEIELGGLIAFLISDVITAEEADAIVEASERFGYRDEAPGIQTPPGMRMNKAVHWVADDQTLAPIFDRIVHLLPHDMDGAQLYPALSRRINMYRYDAEDVFNPARSWSCGCHAKKRFGTFLSPWLWTAQCAARGQPCVWRGIEVRCTN